MLDEFVARVDVRSLAERREQSGTVVDQRGLSLPARMVHRAQSSGEFCKRSCSLDAGGSTADDNHVEWIAFTSEKGAHVVTQRGGVGDGVERKRVLLGARCAEEIRGCARGDDQVGALDSLTARGEGACREVQVGDVGLDDADRVETVKNRGQRACDIGCR